MSKVTFYSHFTKFTRGEKETQVEAKNVRQAIDGLVSKYGDSFRSRLLREDGAPKEFVRIFLNDKDIRLLGNLEAATGPDDHLLIVPAVAGG
jgi:molybdopterin converting factor small subunit